jgi:hypothetical protein
VDVEKKLTAQTVQQLVIPKYHGAKLTDIPDDHLTEILVRTHAER